MACPPLRRHTPALKIADLSSASKMATQISPRRPKSQVGIRLSPSNWVTATVSAFVTRWEPPDALDGVTVSNLRAVQSAIASGRWRENSQAKDWAGYAVAKVLSIDPTKK